MNKIVALLFLFVFALSTLGCKRFSSDAHVEESSAPMSIEQQRDELNTVAFNLMNEAVAAWNNEEVQDDVVDDIISKYCDAAFVSTFKRDEQIYNFIHYELGNYVSEDKLIVYETAYGLLSDCPVEMCHYVIMGNGADFSRIPVVNWEISNVKFDGDDKAIVTYAVSTEYSNDDSKLVFKFIDGAWRVVDCCFYQELVNHIKDFEKRLHAEGINM